VTLVRPVRPRGCDFKENCSRRRRFDGRHSRPDRRARNSFDHLVGERKQPVRHVEPELLRGLEIDDELEPGRLHHRQLGRLLALENPPGIDADLPVRIYSGLGTR
jgi:hypothetical protein